MLLYPSFYSLREEKVTCLHDGGPCSAEIQLLISRCRNGVIYSGISWICHSVEHVLLQWHMHPIVVVGTRVHASGYDLVGKLCGCLYHIMLACTLAHSGVAIGMVARTTQWP